MLKTWDRTQLQHRIVAGYSLPDLKKHSNSRKNEQHQICSRRYIKKAVFLDRDGTIAKDPGYCNRPEDFTMYPGVPQAVKQLNDNNFKVVVITNQSGLARGYFTEEMLNRIHRKMMAEIEAFGGRIDGIYYCPHHPNDKCECRKPKPTLILQATEDHGISLDGSFMVGDMEMDVLAGQSAGCKTVLLRKIDTDGQDISGGTNPDHIAPSLVEAIEWILKQA